jgi:hypothetical protein
MLLQYFLFSVELSKCQKRRATNIPDCGPTDFALILHRRMLVGVLHHATASPPSTDSPTGSARPPVCQGQCRTQTRFKKSHHCCCRRFARWCNGGFGPHGGRNRQSRRRPDAQISAWSDPAPGATNQARVVLGAIFNAVTEGRITASEGAALASLVDSYSRAIDLADVVKRVDALEAKITVAEGA